MAGEDKTKKKPPTTGTGGAAPIAPVAQPPFNVDDDEDEGPELDDEVEEESELEADQLDDDEDDDDEEVVPLTKKKKAEPIEGMLTSANAKGQGADKWANMLDQLNSSSGGGPFFFIKEGKTMLRLAPYKGTEDWFTEVRTLAFGKMKSKFLIMAVVVKTSSGDLNERWINKAVPVVVSKTVLKSILQLLAEDYDLLHPKTGHGLTLIRTGARLDTSYSVLPSHKPQPLSREVTWPDEDLPSLAQIYVERAADQNDQAGTDSLEGGQTNADEQGW